MLNSCVVQVPCFLLGLSHSPKLAELEIQIPLATHVYSCISLRRLKMAALCYADKLVTERTDDVSEVLIEDSIPKTSHANQPGSL